MLRRRLPNLFTLAEILAAFSALAACLAGRAQAAPGLLLFALLFDGLAGQWARRAGARTEIGAELDALASLMAFGVAAGLYLFEAGLRHLGAPGWLAASAFAVSAALRLSRDNAGSPDWPRYQGLPLCASGALAMLAAALGAPPQALALAALALAALGLSPLRYARLELNSPLQPVLGALVLGAAFYGPARWALALLLLAYVLLGSLAEAPGLLESPPRPSAPRPRRGR